MFFKKTDGYSKDLENKFGVIISSEDEDKYGFQLAVIKGLLTSPFTSFSQPFLMLHYYEVVIPIMMTALFAIKLLTIPFTPFIAIAAIVNKCQGEDEKAKEKARTIFSAFASCVAAIPYAAASMLLGLVSIITRTISTIIHFATNQNENTEQPLLQSS